MKRNTKYPNHPGEGYLMIDDPTPYRVNYSPLKAAFWKQKLRRALNWFKQRSATQP